MSTVQEKTHEATGKRSTSASSDGKKASNGTHIWAAKDPWSKPAAKTEKKKSKSNSKPKPEKPVQKVYQAKLMLEEKPETKEVLIKIG